MKAGKASVLLIGLPALGGLLILSGDLPGSRSVLSRKNPPPIAGRTGHSIAGAASRKLMEAYGKLSLSFEPCVEASCGSDASPARFVSRGPGYTLFLTPTEAVLTLRRSQESEVRSQNPESDPPPLRQAQGKQQGSGRLLPSRDHERAGNDPSRARQQAAHPQITPITQNLKQSVESAKSVDQMPSAKSADKPAGSSLVTRHSLLPPAILRMKLVNANPTPKITGLDPLPGKSNYFIGNDPAKWRTNVPTYSKVKYESVYPGIDLIFYGNQGQLEYDFVVAPGADPNAVRLRFGSAEKLEVDAQGDLAVHASGEELLRLRKPVAYQEAAGLRKEISGGYVFTGERGVSFHLGTYEASKPLVIDPVLLYSRYLGGSRDDEGIGVAVDRFGNAYVTGSTGSSDFPLASQPFQTNLRANQDIFVTKIDPAGSIIYSTYLGGAGGSGFEVSSGIAIDTAGNAYITGHTNSTDFPTTFGAFQQAPKVAFDAVVTKLDASGSSLIYSTY